MNSILMNFEREHAQLMHILDRFFGTSNGYLIQMEPVMRDGFPALDTAGQPIFEPRRASGVPNIRETLSHLGICLCGGAINSVFTNGKVNDLDFYVKDEKNIPAAKKFRRLIGQRRFRFPFASK